MVVKPIVIACQWLGNSWLSMAVNGWETHCNCLSVAGKLKVINGYQWQVNLLSFLVSGWETHCKQL
jgi:hypothetical protein